MTEDRKGCQRLFWYTFSHIGIQFRRVGSAVWDRFMACCVGYINLPAVRPKGPTPRRKFDTPLGDLVMTIRTLFVILVLVSTIHCQASA